MDITLFLLRFCKGKNLSKILQGTCSFLDNFPSLFPKRLGNFLICQKRKSNLRESFQVHRIAPSSWNTVINTGVPNFLQSDIYATKSSWSAVHKNEMESLIDFDKDFSLKKKKWLWQLHWHVLCRARSAQQISSLKVVTATTSGNSSAVS